MRTEFFDHLQARVDLAIESLAIKRKVLEQFTDKNLYPYSKFYLRAIKNRSGVYWKNHFSTIGIVGMNEACLNFLGTDITTNRGQAFAVKVMDTAGHDHRDSGSHRGHLQSGSHPGRRHLIPSGHD
jgi:anaerobic ribonucleoside-triphosphate reductase